jgi:cleavage and polyadenylation specificity factor subunit 1
MFSICKQTVPATGVEFAVKCNFFNSLEKCLVIGAANVLKVYRLLPDIELNTKEKFNGKFIVNVRIIIVEVSLRFL